MTDISQCVETESTSIGGDITESRQNVTIVILVLIIVAIIIYICITAKKTSDFRGGRLGYRRYGGYNWPWAYDYDYDYYPYPYNINLVTTQNGEQKRVKIGFAISEDKLLGNKEIMDLYTLGADQNGLYRYLFVKDGNVYDVAKRTVPFRTGDTITFEVDKKNVTFEVRLD